jgi:hypothetical protein
VNRDIFGPLVRRVAPDQPTLEAAAARLALPVPGTLTFNPSPFGRSDTVETPDGGLRLVTDVPGLGYAYEPAGSGRAAGREGGSPAIREPLTSVATRVFSATMNGQTGALGSVVDKASGVELVRAGGGLNELDGATLSDGWVERFPGVGVRLVARRRIAGGMVTSRVTVFDSLPWLNIENAPDEGTDAPDAWRFDFSLSPREMTYEVPGGSLTRPPPVADVPMLRWLALRGAGPVILLGAGGPGAATLDDRSSLTVRLAARLTRFRLMAHSGFLLPDDPWRFGFGMVPLEVVPAAGLGPLRLPTFGRLLEIADPAVAVVGLKDADDGVGVVVYLMDLAGLGRAVEVRPGVLRFDGATATDLTERDAGLLPPSSNGGVLVSVDGHGYAALRLLGVQVAG